MSTYQHDEDDARLEELSAGIRLKRLKDVIPGEDYVLHASYWWKVLGEAAGKWDLDLEIAGPCSWEKPATSVLGGDGGNLVVTASDHSGLQFRDGVLLDSVWPCCGLIYVESASRRGVGDDPEERVFGIFSLRYDSDGSPYYAPTDQEMQPGVAPDWILDPRFDLILSWEPVDVAELLRAYSEGIGD